LIAAIEGEIKQLTIPQQRSEDIRLASTVVNSIEASFRSGDLTVKINDGWYALAEFQQKQLARNILNKSQELDFTHLEIIDSKNQELIARNSVVGNEVVFFNPRQFP
jgi:hypothetical protein